MEGYLGEKPVVVAECEQFASFGPPDWALLFIQKFGGYDGEHHKNWVLDQVSRILLGSEVRVTQASWSNGTTEYRFQVGEASSAYLAWAATLKNRD